MLRYQGTSRLGSKVEIESKRIFQFSTFHLRSKYDPIFRFKNNKLFFLNYEIK
jgi:hypothetical protein